MLRIYVNDNGAVEELSATGTLLGMAAGISAAIAFANVSLAETSPQAARDFREMVRRCVNGSDMWDTEQMRPHVGKSVCALNLLFPEEKAKGDGRDGTDV